MAHCSTPRISAFLRRLTKNQRGATAVEYTLVAVTISLVMIAGVGSIGEAVVAGVGNLIP